MPTPDELEKRFWKELESEMTVMLGLVGVDDGHMRPMTAQIEDGKGPLWFFTSKETEFAEALASGKAQPAIATFTSKGHGLFATVHGKMSIANDRAAIDRLWNRFVAAWFEEGKEDPKLALLRLDPERGEIWENGSSIMAGIKMLVGIDPKKDYKDQVAEVSLR